MNRDLDRLAEVSGIEASYVSETGEYRVIGDDVKRALLDVMGAGSAAEVVHAAGDVGPARDVERCFVSEWLEHERCWGLSLQLYSMRSSRNSGIGDFEDLARLAEMAAGWGADFIGVNPLHALFWREPERCSPYSPSSRTFLNPLYIAVDQLGQGEASGAASLREAMTVDYAGVGAVKRRLLERAYARWPCNEPAFLDFCAKHGEALDTFARFEALSDALSAPARARRSGWSEWPEAYRHPRTNEVAEFAARSKQAIDFHKWLQWVAARQLADAQRRARGAGMRIGLFLDLAVGVAPDGAATWAEQELTATRARVGAPPDASNHEGQDWGLAPMVPNVLAARSFEPFSRDMDASMATAGALRIDHAMGLKRLYWIPRGHDATRGGYVRYPMQGLLDSLARASKRHTCIVIGEDLGTVPAGFRETMRERDIFGYRVFYFERLEDGHYLEPSGYPPQAMCCLATHDMPTLAGWWRGADIDARGELGLFPDDGETVARDDRRRSRRLLLAALADEGLIGGALVRAALSGGDLPRDLPREVAVALHSFLARTPSRLLAVQLEDLAGAVEQVNLPGTDKEYLNWQRKLPVMLEELARLPLLKATVEAIRRVRPRGR
ncbi:MAG: 4-alpha-glucanotransferase [Hyphomicrobium sp.]|jgi:4-alpha-glucanotransferase